MGIGGRRRGRARYPNQDSRCTCPGAQASSADAHDTGTWPAGSSAGVGPAAGGPPAGGGKPGRVPAGAHASRTGAVPGTAAGPEGSSTGGSAHVACGGRSKGGPEGGPAGGGGGLFAPCTCSGLGWAWGRGSG